MTPEEKGAIKIELAAMYNADQAMRKGWLGGKPFDFELDKKHTARMKELVEQLGWPLLSEWEMPAANNMWLLVQHADHDVAFQHHCLELMQALPVEEVIPSNLAFLTDRVRMNEGKPQVYGSQLRKNKEGMYEPYDLEEPETVDARRAAAGLEPLAEYVEGGNALYK